MVREPSEPDPGNAGVGSANMELRIRAHTRLLFTLLNAAPGLLSAHAAWSTAPETAGSLDDVIVTATLRPTTTMETAGSVSVLDNGTLHEGGEQHFENVLSLIPNLNFAAGTNRARYFQIRGIGELDQYEGAPNPSVGLLVDDIDFSGLGSMATLYDMDRVEVLRGPQGTRYGANALAGLIYMTSAAPLNEFGASALVGVGDYGTRSVGAVVTGPVSALDSSFRFAVQRYTSDGTIINNYLHRNDTNGRDETTLRGRWHWRASPTVGVDITVLHVAIDDGYDAFSPENGRTTHSNKPGVDVQHSNGVALHTTWTAESGRTLTFIGSWADSQIVYSYDGDWGNSLYWAPYVYDFTEVQNRHRSTESAELRFSSADSSPVRWLVGAYALDLRESLRDINLGVSIDPINGEYDLSTVLNSGYDSRSTALYGVLDGEIGASTHWSAGLRGEHHRAGYDDNLVDYIAGSSESHAFSPAENLWGGHLSVTHDLESHRSIYLQLSRGYKAGGFNLSDGLAPSEITFRAESDWNLETGYKTRGARIDLDSDVFVVSRHRAQLRTSVQTDPMNPNSFIFYTGNAASGLDYGLESTLRWRLTDCFSTGGSLGLLHTAFHNFVRVGDSGIESVSRELPNAPHVNGSWFTEYRDPSGRYARLDVTGMSRFYFDLPPNPTEASGRVLGDLRIGRDTPRWSAAAYVRNIANHSYATRGFYFGLVPPNYPNALYVQLGEPRVFGAEITVRIGSLERR
jgi:outer membrane receptor protein involved in Fe transport